MSLLGASHAHNYFQPRARLSIMVNGFTVYGLPALFTELQLYRCHLYC